MTARYSAQDFRVLGGLLLVLQFGVGMLLGFDLMLEEPLRIFSLWLLLPLAGAVLMQWPRRGCTLRFAGAILLSLVLSATATFAGSVVLEKGLDTISRSHFFREAIGIDGD